ncbi:MAG: acyltransferase [Candidatus Symbiothrix sp.]|jgi:acetyltransferase-like isoleucine patch superfamily enzyme|nr:acyltransferase [Candidatus Symbiothrix sp.]
MKTINKILGRLKGEQFILDKKIPFSYMFLFFCRKTVNLLYGCFVFRRLSLIFVHPSAKILCKCKLRFGRNLNIDRCCYLDALSKEGIALGNNVSVGKNTTIECSGSLKYLGKGLKVGNNVGLGTHGFFGCAGGVEIGDDCIFGNFVSLHSENHNYEDINLPIRLQGVNHKGIKIGKNCWIGAKVTILDGTEIGNHCVVAAGAVVRGVYPGNCIIGGVPSKIIRNI